MCFAAVALFLYGNGEVGAPRCRGFHNGYGECRFDPRVVLVVGIGLEINLSREFLLAIKPDFDMNVHGSVGGAIEIASWQKRVKGVVA